MIGAPPSSTRRAGERDVRPAAAGADAAQLLYERHGQRIYGYCLSRLRNRQEAEDAVQTTFLYAFASLGRGVVPETELAWLFTIARNVCSTRRRTLWRRGRVEATTDLGAVQDELGHVAEPADELWGLSEALTGMPDSQRQALLLREWQGLSYDEIGEQLSLSRSAVEALLFRARRTLANRLQPVAGKVAVLVNVAALLKLARRLAGGGLKAKAATAVVAAGVAAGTSVPIERSLTHHHATSTAASQGRESAPVAARPAVAAAVGAPAEQAAARPAAPVLSATDRVESAPSSAQEQGPPAEGTGQAGGGAVADASPPADAPSGRGAERPAAQATRLPAPRVAAPAVTLPGGLPALSPQLPEPKLPLPAVPGVTSAVTDAVGAVEAAAGSLTVPGVTEPPPPGSGAPPPVQLPPVEVPPVDVPPVQLPPVNVPPLGP